MPFATPLASRHSLSKANDPSIMIVPLAARLMCWLPPTENWKVLELASAGPATATSADVASRAETVETARIRMVVSLRGVGGGTTLEGTACPPLGAGLQAA